MYYKKKNCYRFDVAYTHYVFSSILKNLNEVLPDGKLVKMLQSDTLRVQVSHE